MSGDENEKGVYRQKCEGVRMPENRQQGRNYFTLSFLLAKKIST